MILLPPPPARTDTQMKPDAASGVRERRACAGLPKPWAPAPWQPSVLLVCCLSNPSAGLRGWEPGPEAFPGGFAVTGAAEGVRAGGLDWARSLSRLSSVADTLRLPRPHGGRHGARCAPSQHLIPFLCLTPGLQGLLNTSPFCPGALGLVGLWSPTPATWARRGAGLLSPLSSQHKATTFATTLRAPTSALPASTLSLQNSHACCEKLLSDFSWGPISKPHMA